MGELTTLISTRIPGAEVTPMAHYPDRKLGDTLGSKQFSMCFLDTTTNLDAALATITEVNKIGPSIPIVVLLGGNEPDLILRCLRQGATEFLIHPLSAEQLQPVLQRLDHQSSGGIGGGARIISVVPVKGACGASTIASNLAFQWKKVGIKRVLLADFDPAAGTLSFQLKLKSSYTFLDALSRSGNLDADLWRGLVVQCGGIDVLLSPENPMDANVELNDPADVLEFCRQIYDNITIDLPGAYSTWVLQVVRASDEVLLVTTNELPALRAAQRALNHFDRHGIDRSKIRLVINRFTPEVGLNQASIQTALHTEVFHMFPNEYDIVQRALVEGKPLAPITLLGKSMVALAEKISGVKVGGNAPEKKKATGLGALLASLTSRISS